MSEIAFIGDRDTVWPFKALGNDVFFSDEHDLPTRLFADVVRQDFKLIFVTEEFYDAVRDAVHELSEDALPTVVILPSVKGARGITMQLIRDSVRRATGAELV